MRTLLLTIAVLCAPPAMAHDGQPRAVVDYSKAEQHLFGRAADPKRAKRVVRVEMMDQMRFSPAELTVKRGEIVRFVPVNKGQMVHEMVLGTLDDLKKHADMMRKHPGMEHDEPHMAHVAPGKSGEMGWQFNRAGEFYFGCLVPGHFEAGMVGKVKVTP